MGLDMYLLQTKRVDGVKPEELGNISEYLRYERAVKEEGLTKTFAEYTGIDVKELDMTHVEAFRDEFHDCGFNWYSIFNEIGYWRKANQIHSWFVDNIQGGHDDCGVYEVSASKLGLLLDTCKKVVKDSKLGIDETGNTYIKDYSTADELLPTQAGFFFGDTDYDAAYLEAVKHTIYILEQTLAEVDFKKEAVFYQSSW